MADLQTRTSQFNCVCFSNLRSLKALRSLLVNDHIMIVHQTNFQIYCFLLSTLGRKLNVLRIEQIFYPHKQLFYLITFSPQTFENHSIRTYSQEVNCLSKSHKDISLFSCKSCFLVNHCQSEFLKRIVMKVFSSNFCN